VGLTGLHIAFNMVVPYNDIKILFLGQGGKALVQTGPGVGVHHDQGINHIKVNLLGRIKIKQIFVNG